MSCFILYLKVKIKVHNIIKKIFLLHAFDEKKSAYCNSLNNYCYVGYNILEAFDRKLWSISVTIENTELFVCFIAALNKNAISDFFLFLS